MIHCATGHAFEIHPPQYSVATTAPAREASCPCTGATEVEGDVRSAAAGTGRQRRRPGRSEFAGRRAERRGGASWLARDVCDRCRTTAPMTANVSRTAATGGPTGIVTRHPPRRSTRKSRRRCSTFGTGRRPHHAPASRVICPGLSERSRGLMGRTRRQVARRHAPASRRKWLKRRAIEGGSWDTPSRTRFDLRSRS